MGYSGRYHAASLAAVFLALAVGILIGVGFGSDLVSGTADDLEQSLESDLDAAREREEELEAELAGRDDFTDELIPAVVAQRLRGREVGLVAFGALDEELAGNVRASLVGTGATLSEIAVVREPPDLAAAAGALAAPRRASRTERLARTAELAGRLLVRGGPRFDELRAALFSRYSGEPGDLDGVVITRSRPAGLGERETALTDVLEERMLAGIRQAGGQGRGIAIVAVERSDSEASSVEFFSERGVTTVDNADQAAGRISIVFALDGAEGDFGVKETADRLLPDLLAPPSFGFGPEAGQG